MNQATREVRGFAFVAFRHSAAAMRAISELHDYELDGQKLRVDQSKRKTAYERTPGVFHGPAWASVKLQREREAERLRGERGREQAGERFGGPPPPRRDEAPPSRGGGDRDRYYESSHAIGPPFESDGPARREQRDERDRPRVADRYDRDPPPARHPSEWEDDRRRHSPPRSNGASGAGYGDGRRPSDGFARGRSPPRGYPPPQRAYDDRANGGGGFGGGGGGGGAYGDERPRGGGGGYDDRRYGGEPGFDHRADRYDDRGPPPPRQRALDAGPRLREFDAGPGRPPPRGGDEYNGYPPPERERDYYRERYVPNDDSRGDRYREDGPPPPPQQDRGYYPPERERDYHAPPRSRDEWR